MANIYKGKWDGKVDYVRCELCGYVWVGDDREERAKEHVQQYHSEQAEKQSEKK